MTDTPATGTITPPTCTCGGTPVADIRITETPATFEIAAPADAVPPGGRIKCTSTMTVRLGVALTCPDCDAVTTIPGGKTIDGLTDIYRDQSARILARRVRDAAELAHNVWGRRDDEPRRGLHFGPPESTFTTAAGRAPWSDPDSNPLRDLQEALDAARDAAVTVKPGPVVTLTDDEISHTEAARAFDRSETERVFAHLAEEIKRGVRTASPKRPFGNSFSATEGPTP